MRSIVYSMAIGKSWILPHGANCHASQPLPHRERPRGKTWGASTLRNSAVEFDRRKPPDEGGEEVEDAETCVISLRCTRHRRARPRALMGLFHFLVHVGNRVSGGVGGRWQRCLRGDAVRYCTFAKSLRARFTSGDGGHEPAPNEHFPRIPYIIMNH